MDEVDASTGGSVLRLVVKKSGTLLTQVIAEGVNIGRAQTHLLQTRALLVEELSDRRLFVQRSQNLNHSLQLREGLRANHGFLNTLLFICFDVVADPPHVRAVPSSVASKSAVAIPT